MFFRIVIMLLLISTDFLLASETKTVESVSHEWATPLDKSIVKNGYKVNTLIYRSAQPDKDSFQKLYKMGIRKTLNLRIFHNDRKEIAGLPIEEIHMPLYILNVNKNDIVKIVKILADTKEPILIHCKYGSDRTGVVIAAYRIMVEGWSPEEAIEEMINGGYSYLRALTNLPIILKSLEVGALSPENRGL